MGRLMLPFLLPDAAPYSHSGASGQIIVLPLTRMRSSRCLDFSRQVIEGGVNAALVKRNARRLEAHFHAG